MNETLYEPVELIDQDLDEVPVVVITVTLTSISGTLSRNTMRASIK